MTYELTAILWRLAVVVLSLSAHEAAHGISARWLGDDTPARLGRVTLNPLKHLDVQGSLVVPCLFLATQWVAGAGSPLILGWAKPVPVDPRNFRHPYGHMALVAAAGPLSNLLIALAAAQFFWGWAVLARGVDAPLVLLRTPEAALLVPVIVVNIALMVFNLIPIPPLDGSKMLWGPMLPFMPARFQDWYGGLAPGQRIFGPLAAVLLAGLLLHLGGWEPWGWFTAAFGLVVFWVFAGVLDIASAGWFWA